MHSEAPDPNNKYNQNFQNRFCGCECDYDPEQQKGTMFQCLGLGTAENGGCGEDWWHPGCVVGLGPDWFETSSKKGTPKQVKNEGLLEPITEVAEAVGDEANSATKEDVQVNGSTEAGEPAETAEPNEEDEEDEDDDPPMPPGFPPEDDFDGFICYKCVDANPWIKRYAGAPGFLGPVFRRSAAPSPEEAISSDLSNAKKRKLEDEEPDLSTVKRLKDETSVDGAASTELPGTANNTTNSPDAADKPCKVKTLPPAPVGQISLFFKSDFRDHLCRCSDCFPNLAKHPYLLEEEETYEPPLSENGDEAGGSTIGSGSIYERGESALKNIDRVKAIEGVMAYNHLKDKLKPFFQQFAESGKAISAEDIKAYFAKMRGDEQAIQEAGEGAKSADNRTEQSGH